MRLSFGVKVLFVLLGLAVLPALPLIAATFVLTLPFLIVVGGIAFYQLPRNEAASQGVASLALDSSTGEVN